MRLIDADALLEKSKTTTFFALKDKAWSVFLLNKCKKFLKIMVSDTPTIDPEELRPKGRWVRVQDSECYWYECSVCGEQPLRRYNHDCFTLYCPFCGARMEVDEC